MAHRLSMELETRTVRIGGPWAKLTDRDNLAAAVASCGPGYQLVAMFPAEFERQRETDGPRRYRITEVIIVCQRGRTAQGAL